MLIIYKITELFCNNISKLQNNSYICSVIIIKKSLKMDFQELNNTIDYLKNENFEIYNSIKSFSNFLLKKGVKIDSVKDSFKSLSTYVDFYWENPEDEFDYAYVTVRFSDHTATGNFGTTDFSFENIYPSMDKSCEENYKTFMTFVDEKR